MNKSLVPLIVSFAVIILLTFIVIYSKHEKAFDGEVKEDEVPMTLSTLTFKKTVKKQIPKTSAKPYSPDTKGMLDKARLLLSEGKEAEAEEILRTILIFEPDNTSVLSLLGGIFYYSQRYKDAELIFKKQINLYPEKASFYNQLGSVLAKQNRFSEAIEITEKALKLDPNSADSQINLAGMYSFKGEKDIANRHLLNAYKLIGYRILPFLLDPSFDSVRNTPEFQEIVQIAKGEWKIQKNLKTQNTTDEITTTTSDGENK